MSWLRYRWLPLSALVAAAAALVASVLYVAGSAAWWSAGTMGPAMCGDGAVRTLADADRAASRFAERWGLHVSDVMQFENGFYAELVDSAGDGATEVLIDPGSGAVQTEWGPAMMWNTAYGMHPAFGERAATLGQDQARRIADLWVRDNRPGEHADQADRFPGYYTLHTMRGNQVVGMLSVHATSGAVWYHNWHGRFVGMQELTD